MRAYCRGGLIRGGIGLKKFVVFGDIPFDIFTPITTFNATNTGRKVLSKGHTILFVELMTVFSFVALYSADRTPNTCSHMHGWGLF